MSAPAEPGGAYDPATLAFYDAEAPEYVASGKDGVSRWLPQFIDMLPVGARVLELGCGGGRDAEAMLLHGLDVEPTDGSAAIAAKAQQRLGRPVRVMRFDELSSVEAYDAVWASASLLHVPLGKLPAVLGRVFRSLRPGGLHFASYKAAGTPGRDHAGRYFNHPDGNALVAAYQRSASWELLSVVEYVGGGYESGQGPWIALTARRPVGPEAAGEGLDRPHLLSLPAHADR
jgi:SAM-dependent methyltransferase